jgi:hypothetical protein
MQVKFIREPFLLYLFNIYNVAKEHSHPYPVIKDEFYTYALIERARQIKPTKDIYGIYQL